MSSFATLTTTMTEISIAPQLHKPLPQVDDRIKSLDTPTTSAQRACRTSLPWLTLPTDRKIIADVDQLTLFHLLCSTFEIHIPAEVTEKDETAFLLKLTAFEEYAPIDVEIYIQTLADNSSEAIIRHPSRQDVVRFQLVVKRLTKCVRAAMGVKEEPRRTMEFDEWCSWECGEDEDWPSILQPLFAMACSTIPLDRQEAAVALATMAEQSPACHVTLAEAVAQRSDVMMDILSVPSAPLALQYPAAAMLATLAGCSKGQELLSPLVCSLTRHATGGLVGRTLALARDSVQGTGPTHR